MAYAHQGFTLLEVLLSIAIIALLAGMSVPIYQGLQVRNDLDVSVNSVVGSFRRAAELARASEGDAAWGVYIATTTGVVLFKGADYASRDIVFDEILPLPTTMIVTGLSEVIFSKFSGFPQTTGTTTLTSSANEFRTIFQNEKGTITY